MSEVTDLMNKAPNDLESFWMPFTPNRIFKRDPLLLSASKGACYYTPDGREVVDAAAGLWCVNAGHGRTEIADAVNTILRQSDFIPTFQFCHPLAFAAAAKVLSFTPEEYSQVFFANSGSEAIDTVLKIALAYHYACGEPQRNRFISRSRGYHGINMGGTSLAGIMKNRMQFQSVLPNISHIRDTHDLARNAFSRGQPAHGAEFADDLERQIAIYGAHTIAGVIVEPVAGSTGVLIPPQGYLERLREICDHHGLLLIFDEVITGWGRLGTPFANQYFDAKPDLFTLAKGLTNGTIPMGAVVAREGIYEACLDWAERTGEMIEFYHGGTYAAHPVASAALCATLDIYRNERLFDRVRDDLAPLLEEKLHSLADAPHVIDIRNLGFIGAVELAPREGAPGKRGIEASRLCFERGAMVRFTGDTLAFSPPFIAEEEHLDRIVTAVRGALEALA